MANPETAVTVVEQPIEANVVEYALDAYPASEYNRLVPTDVIGVATDLIRPVVQAVRLDIERDTYSSQDLPDGHRALNARGMSLVAQAAGVDFPDDVRVDDGSKPMRASAKTWATIVDGTGRVRTVVGSRDYDLTVQKMTDRQRDRAKAYVYENAVTRARHRALRLLLGLAQSYSVEELRKPFACVSYVPNMQHPEIREAYKQALLPAIAATFGPAAQKQLAAGDQVVDLDAIPEKARDVTPAPDVPTTLPGENLAKAQADDEVPDWVRPTGPAVAEKKGGKAKPTLIDRLRDNAEASGLVGDATEPQRAKLRELIGGFDWPTETAPVLTAAFGEDAARTLTAAQAQAIIDLAGAEDDFAGAWREAAAAVRKGAAA